MKRLPERGLAHRVKPGSSLHEALVKINPDATVFHVLTETPEQMEDSFAVLVDDRLVVAFDLRRSDPLQQPENVKNYHLQEYRRGLRGIAEADFQVALGQAKAHFTGE
jgi:hypothetical protein